PSQSSSAVSAASSITSAGLLSTISRTRLESAMLRRSPPLSNTRISPRREAFTSSSNFRVIGVNQLLIFRENPLESFAWTFVVGRKIYPSTDRPARQSPKRSSGSAILGAGHHVVGEHGQKRHPRTDRVPVLLRHN